jgi:hypothetical protein
MPISVIGANGLVNPAVSITIYTSGSGTYTTPSGTRYLQIKMIGGGGGGGGGGYPGASAGNVGGNSTINSTLLVCTGGGYGTVAGLPGNGGEGGQGTVNSPAVGIGVKGGSGVNISGPFTGSGLAGTAGGSGAFGGGGGSFGATAKVGNSGGGGAGGYCTTAGNN